MPKNAWRVQKAPSATCLRAIMFSMSASGSGSPVTTWRDTCFRIDGSHIQFSSICDGASTKSRRTLVPCSEAYGAVDSVACIR